MFKIVQNCFQTSWRRKAHVDSHIIRFKETLLLFPSLKNGEELGRIDSLVP